MKMQTKNLRNSLAAEYVIGTLIGGARTRFEFYMHQDPSLQALVQKWGQLLNPLGGMLKPVKPPKRVWKNIERRLQLKQLNKGFWSSLFLWRSISSLSAAIAIVLGLYLGPFQPVDTESVSKDYLAVIQNAQSQSAWLISTDVKQKRLVVRNLNVQQLAANKDFELWLLPNSKIKQSFKAPISMGLINADSITELQLTTTQLAAIQLAGGVAVSLEPIGGSTTGLPTGPVLYQGKLQFL